MFMAFTPPCRNPNIQICSSLAAEFFCEIRKRGNVMRRNTRNRVPNNVRALNKRLAHLLIACIMGSASAGGRAGSDAYYAEAMNLVSP